MTATQGLPALRRRRDRGRARGLAIGYFLARQGRRFVILDGADPRSDHSHGNVGCPLERR